MLSLIPKWSEDWVIILGPALFIAALILLPLVAGKGERSPIRRPWSFVIVAFIMFMIAYYGAVGKIAPWSPRMDASPLSVQVVGATSGPVAEGAKVFHDKGCEYCHMISGYGGIRGPDLTYAGDTMTPAQMTTRIYSGGDQYAILQRQSDSGPVIRAACVPRFPPPPAGVADTAESEVRATELWIRAYAQSPRHVEWQTAGQPDGSHRYNAPHLLPAGGGAGGSLFKGVIARHGKDHPELKRMEALFSAIARIS